MRNELIKNIYLKLICWLKDDSSTKATWVLCVVTSLALFANTYVLFQNSKAIDLSRKTLEMSYVPSLEFQLHLDTNSYLINTSNQVIKDVYIYTNAYVFDNSLENVEIRNSPTLLGPNKETLKPFEKIKLNYSMLATLDEGAFDLNNLNVFRSIVVKFRREIDNKQYIAVHPYQATSANGKLMIISLREGQKSGGWDGPPGKYLKVIKKIREIENELFDSYYEYWPTNHSSGRE